MAQSKNPVLTATVKVFGFMAAFAYKEDIQLNIYMLDLKMPPKVDNVQILFSFSWTLTIDFTIFSNSLSI